MNLLIYHGSSKIIETPLLGEGKIYNDYGRGFYCTEHKELAQEWACTETADGYVNSYEINTDGLNILYLSSEKYTILNWLALLVRYRKIRISTPVMKKGVEWLINNFLVDTDQFDAITGYRADDSYFSFARAFVANEISLRQLETAMKLGKPGEQFVLKSQKAFDSIHFLAYETVAGEMYYAKRKLRDEEAREAYAAEAETEDINGIFMRDIIREEMRADDARLR